MHGYTKLFGSIVNSTIWREEKHVKVVWVTMLAIKDRDGIVEASVPGLADLARVSLEEVKDALDKLSSPDPSSRTKDLEGRRIVEVDGGWRVVNAAKYRDKMNADERREKNREYQRQFRAKRKGVVSTEPDKSAMSGIRSDQIRSDPDQNSPPSSSVGSPEGSTASPPTHGTAASPSSLARSKGMGPNIFEPEKKKPVNAKFVPPTLEAMKLQFAKSGGTEDQAEACWNYYESNGWKVGRNRMQKWENAVGGWIARERSNPPLSARTTGKTGGNFRFKTEMKDPNPVTVRILTPTPKQ